MLHSRVNNYFIFTEGLSGGVVNCTLAARRITMQTRLVFSNDSFEYAQQGSLSGGAASMDFVLLPGEVRGRGDVGRRGRLDAILGGDSGGGMAVHLNMAPRATMIIIITKSGR